MISGLKGKIQYFGPAQVHLDTGNIHYEVHVPLNVMEKLQREKDQEHFLFIHHQFNQDDQKLYGFLDMQQRDFFRAIQTIKGMGASLALSILSHLDGTTLLDVCRKEDISTLSKIPRIGKNTAERIVFEISRNEKKFEKLTLVASTGEQQPTVFASNNQELAMQALQGWGYKDSQVGRLLATISSEQPESVNYSIEEWIRAFFRRI